MQLERISEEIEDFTSFATDVRLEYFFTCLQVQFFTRDAHHLTFLFEIFHDHSLPQVGLPIFEWETLKLFIHHWVEKIVLVSVTLDPTVDC